MNPNLRIRIDLILPNNGKRLSAVLQVDEHLFADSFAPLPRDRELYFASDAQQKAAWQKQMRRKIARTLGEQLAHKILELIEAEDPQQGYSPEEWRRMHSAND